MSESKKPSERCVERFGPHPHQRVVDGWEILRVLDELHERLAKLERPQLVEGLIGKTEHGDNVFGLMPAEYEPEAEGSEEL